MIRSMSALLAARSNALADGRDTKPVEGFNYDEAVDGTDHSGISGECGIRVGISDDQCVRELRLVVSIRGVEGGGLVKDFLPHVSDRRGRCSVEMPHGNCHH